MRDRKRYAVAQAGLCVLRRKGEEEEGGEGEGEEGEGEGEDGETGIYP